MTPTVPRAVQYGGVFGAHLGRAAPGIRTRVPDACKEIAEGPGCFAWLPRQIPHTYANVSASPVHMVGGAVPGGIEEFFAAQAAYIRAAGQRYWQPSTYSTAGSSPPRMRVTKPLDSSATICDLPDWEANTR